MRERAYAVMLNRYSLRLGYNKMIEEVEKAKYPGRAAAPKRVLSASFPVGLAPDLTQTKSDVYNRSKRVTQIFLANRKWI
jgi:hypothetical protein